MLDKTSVLEEFHKIQAEKTNLSKEKGGLEKEWCQHFEKLKSENDELRGDNCKLAQRVVDLKKQCQTYKDKCSKLQNNFETTEKKYLEEMREVYVSVQEKIEQRDKDSAEEILKLQRKYESNEESYNEMKNQVKVFKQLLDQKAKVIDSQKEGINHLKFEIAKLKFRILDLGAKETTELKDWTRRFSCIGDIDSMSSLPDYNSAVTRGHLRMDSSALPGTPGNSSTVSGFTCEEEEGHFNDHSKNLSHLIAGICEADDKNRLLELQRRNTLCAPHLKTTYPVETQTWSASKDPNKLASQVKKQQKADKAILNKKMPVRKSERLSNSNLEISYVEPKRKRVKKDILLNTPTPDKRTKSFWRKSAATPECSYDASEASTSTGKKRSWKKPIKEFLTPSKGKTFKVPKSRFNAN